MVIRSTVLRKTLASFASGACALLMAEILLRVYSAPYFYVWKPGVTTVSHIVPGHMPGIEGSATFAINEDGLRADSFSDAHRFRILVLGGSTTECFYLDTEEAWPHLLQRDLEEAWGVPVWVGSAGKSGHRSLQHVPEAMMLLEQYPQMDVLLVLMGINDLHQFLAKDKPGRRMLSFDEMSPAHKDRVIRSTFAYIPPTRRVAGPFWKHTALWNLLDRTRLRLHSVFAPQLNVLDEGGQFYVERRRWRAAATRIRTELPSLATPLREFRRNLLTIASVAREQGVRPVFLTQPVMWREDLPASLRRLLAFGGLGPGFSKPSEVYYSVEALARGMRSFNETMIAACEKDGIDCVDLASMLPQDETTFFDDCHFNESGARAVAHVVAHHLLAIVEPPGSAALSLASGSESK